MQTGAEAAANRLAAIVERARNGDQNAYGELVELMWPRLVALARTILAGDDEAEDLAQEALVHAWTRLGSLRRPDRFAPWVSRILARRCFAHLRRPRPSADALAEQSTGPWLAAIDVRRMLTRLAPRQRAVLYLTMVEGRTAREAAALLGMLPATARVHRHRAIAKLRRLFAEG